MRNVLIGAVESTRVALEALVAAGMPPAAVITLPLSKASRHSDFADLRPGCARSGVPLVEQNGPSSETTSLLRELSPELVLVIGWSQILPAEALGIPPAGTIGFHPAPIPENRGRAVIPWTILQRRSQTGATLFWIDEGVDSGDVLDQELFPVAADETAATLYAKHLDALRTMLERTVPDLLAGRARRTPQDAARATYCARRRPEDGWIDWAAPAGDVWTLIRASGRPYPGAWTHHRGQPLICWSAELRDDDRYWGLPGQVQALLPEGALIQCGDRGHLLLKEVQWGAEPARNAAQVLRQHERLGHEPWRPRCPERNGVDG